MKIKISITHITRGLIIHHLLMVILCLLVSTHVSAVPKDDTEPPIPDPKPETVPNSPILKIMWKDSNSIKLQWWDRSFAEYGFKLKQKNSKNGWDIVGDFPALNSSSPRDSHIVGNLASETRYCFQVIAYNNYGYSNSNNIQQACAETGSLESCPGSFVESQVLTTATSSSPTVEVDCDLNLEPGQVITKSIVFAGAKSSGTTLDCNNAVLDAGLGRYNYQRRHMIYIMSTYRNNAWTRPQGITVNNCKVYGSIIVKGIVYKPNLVALSRRSNYVSIVRQGAPTNILFQNMSVTAVYPTTPFYLATGVTNTILENSEINGESASIAVYLDAESSNNTIRNNYIHTKSPRELIAIDASSHNTIINNRFSALNNGGIYLYRNCGEFHISRHTTPSFNTIVNNIFYYDKYKAYNPAIYIASRNGKTRKGTTEYCGNDDDSQYGSGISDLDFARFNVVMQNQIYKRQVPEMIRVRNKPINSPNFIEHNETVNQQTVDSTRRAGCFLEQDNIGFILDGEFFDVLITQYITHRHTCRNGELFRQIFYKWLLANDITTQGRFD